MNYPFEFPFGIWKLLRGCNHCWPFFRFFFSKHLNSVLIFFLMLLFSKRQTVATTSCSKRWCLSLFFARPSPYSSPPPLPFELAETTGASLKVFVSVSIYCRQRIRKAPPPLLFSQPSSPPKGLYFSLFSFHLWTQLPM